MRETRVEYVADRLMWLMLAPALANYADSDWIGRMMAAILLLCCVVGAAVDLLNRKRFPPRSSMGAGT